ncbi:hypothetical protein pb186bvf_009920 [Paramecium bursaria]
MDNWNQIFTYSIRMSFLSISFLSYIFIITIILKYKLYRIQAGALYLVLSIIQGFMIFLPTIIILLYDLQPVEEGVLCNYQSYSVLVGYIWATGFSILMAIIVLRTYYGLQTNKDFIRLFIIIWLVQFVVYLVINQFVFDFSPQPLPLHFNKIEIKQFCSGVNKSKILYGICDLLYLLIWIVIRFYSYKRDKLLQSQNIIIKEVILSVQNLGGSQILLFSFNQLLKVLDHLFINVYLWLDIFLYFLNELYSLEGLVVTYIFLTAFQGFLKVRAPQLYYLIPNQRITYSGQLSQ